MEKNKTSKFMQQKGFYVVLAVCLCILVTSAVWVARKNAQALLQSAEQEDSLAGLEEDYGKEEQSDTVDKAQQQLQKASEVKVQVEPKQQSEPVKQPSKTEVNGKTQNLDGAEQRDDGPKVAAFSKVEKMSLPVQGKVVKYFGDELSDVTGEWNYNKGIDIGSKAGTQVKAALNGTVEKIENSEMKGITIVLNHGDGLQTEYSNLSTKDLVKVGMRVQRGQIISGVAKEYALGAFTDQEHVHFGVLQDGSYIDPMTRVK